LKIEKIVFQCFPHIPFFYFDKTVVTWIKNFHCALSMNHLGQALNPAIKFLSHGATLMAFSIILYGVGKIFRRKISDARRSLLVGLVFAGLVGQALKHIVGRARPCLTFDPYLSGRP
jgi:hypothetical protein